MINIQTTSPIIGIYKITSPSGKIYIGQSVNITKRWKQYNTNIKTSSIGPKLFNSIQKYGWDNHIKEIIEECPESYLNELETWWKLFYNSVEDGLNCGYWDKGGGPKSGETKNKMSKFHKNHLVKSDIISKRLINCRKSSTNDSKLKRIKNTCWEVRNKKLNAPRGTYIKYEQYDINNNFIKGYDNIQTLLNEFNNSRAQNLYSCLKGKYNTWMGFKWKGYKIYKE